MYYFESDDETLVPGTTTRLKSYENSTLSEKITLRSLRSDFNGSSTLFDSNYGNLTLRNNKKDFLQ